MLVLISLVAGCDKELKKARTFEEQGDWPKAQEALEQAIKKKPDNPVYQNELGYVYQQRGYFGESEKTYTRAIQMDPYYLEAFYNRGSLYFSMGKINESKKDFEKVISLDKNYAKAYNNIGLLNVTYFNKQDEALNNYKKAIELEPDNPIYHSNLAELYKKMGKLDLAREEAERARVLGGGKGG